MVLGDKKVLLKAKKAHVRANLKEDNFVKK